MSFRINLVPFQILEGTLFHETMVTDFFVIALSTKGASWDLKKNRTYTKFKIVGQYQYLK